MNTAEHNTNPAVPTIAPGHGSPTVTIDGHLYAAAAWPVGKQGKVEITVYRDGEVWRTRTSGRDRYAYVHLQGFPTGHGSVPADAAAHERIGLRYSAKPMAKGAAIDYGFCIGSVAIQRLDAKPEAQATWETYAEQAPEQTGTCQVCKTRPSTGWTGATDASPATERCDECSTETCGAWTSWPRPGRAPAAAALAFVAVTRATTTPEAIVMQTVNLARAREAKAAADAAWRHAIVEAHQAGMSDRAIARELGVSHPTVAKIVAALVGAR